MGEPPTELSVSAIRRTIATALAAAFGFVIALLWRDVVLAALAIGGISLESGGGLTDLVVFTGTAIGVTVLMVILIVLVSRWSGNR